MEREIGTGRISLAGALGLGPVKVEDEERPARASPLAGACSLGLLLACAGHGRMKGRRRGPPLMSRLFQEVICSMKCTHAQCSSNAVRAMVGFSNLSRFFDLGLTINEFWYFFEIGHKEGVGQLKSRYKLLDASSKGDHEWARDTLEVYGECKSDSSPELRVPTTFISDSEFGSTPRTSADMKKVHVALGIPAEYLERVNSELQSACFAKDEEFVFMHAEVSRLNEVASRFESKEVDLQGALFDSENLKKELDELHSAHTGLVEENVQLKNEKAGHEAAEGQAVQARVAEDELMEALVTKSGVAVEGVAVEEPVVAQAANE